jgi:hypothetical protein
MFHQLLLTIVLDEPRTLYFCDSAERFDRQRADRGGGFWASVDGNCRLSVRREKSLSHSLLVQCRSTAFTMSYRDWAHAVKYPKYRVDRECTYPICSPLCDEVPYANLLEDPISPAHGQLNPGVLHLVSDVAGIDIDDSAQCTTSTLNSVGFERARRSRSLGC